MAIKIRNRVKAEFSSASMSDLIFLLLIFFVMTSTLVSPNVIPLLLPNSKAKQVIEVKSFEVYIDGTYQFFVDPKNNPNPVSKEALEGAIEAKLSGLAEGNVVLRADKTVQVQDVVSVIDAVNQINKRTGKNYKVVLATQNK